MVRVVEESPVPGFGRLSRSITIQQAANEVEVDHFDTVKMDVEGAEVAIFASEESNLLYSSRAISVELHSIGAANDIPKMLADHGFSLQRPLAPESSGTSVAMSVLRHPAFALRMEVRNRFRTTRRLIRLGQGGHRSDYFAPQMGHFFREQA